MKTDNQLTQDYNEYMEGQEESEGVFLLIGVDGLRAINVRRGHAYGDLVLRTLWDCIIAEIEEDSVYRVGGADSFLIFLKGSYGEEDAKKVFYDLRERMEETFKKQDFKMSFTISAGIILFPKSQISCNEMFTFAEFALLQAKSNGRNCCVMFNREEFRYYVKRNELYHLLQQAVADNFSGFEVHYQVLMDLETMEPCGAEALLRFRSGDRVISPAEFIPVLEENGLIVPVGLYVMEQAMKMSLKMREYDPDFVIHINISYVQFKQSFLYGEVMNLLKKTGAFPHNLVFEITESGYLMDDRRVHNVLSEFRTAGFRIALDDFGTGYSNFIYLKDAELDIVKLDKMFVSGALENENEYRLMQQIIDIVHSLGLQICLEGIETMSELSTFRKEKPDSVQGFVFGRPVPEDVFLQRYRNYNAWEDEGNWKEGGPEKTDENQQGGLKKRFKKLDLHWLRRMRDYGKNTHNLSTAILPFILVMVIFVAGFTEYFSYWMSSSYADEMIDATMDSEEEYLISLVSNARYLARSIADTVSRDYENGTVGDYENLLLSSAENHITIKGCGLWFEPYVYDENEKYVGPYAIRTESGASITYEYSGSAYDYLRQNYYVRTKVSKSLNVTLPYYDETMDATIITISAPVSTSDGNYLGCATVDFTVDSLRTLIKMGGIDSDEEFMIVGLRGSYIAGAESGEEFCREAPDSSNTSKKAAYHTLAFKNSGSAVYKEGGDMYKLYFRQISSLNWKLVMRINMTEKYRKIASYLAVFVGISLLVLVMGSLLLFFYLRKLSKNEEKLQYQKMIYDETQLSAVQSTFELIANIDLSADTILMVYKRGKSSLRNVNENSYNSHRRGFSATLHPEDRERYMQFTDPKHLKETLREKSFVSSEFRVCSQQEYIWEEITITRWKQKGASGFSDQYTYMIRDINERKLVQELNDMEKQILITQLRQANEVLFRHGISDSLTGVYNREGLEHYAPDVLEAAGKEGMQLFVMLADVNRLKLINDTFGHLSGDAAILMVSQVLTCLKDTVQVCARIGGDEFVYLAAVEEGSGVIEHMLEQFRSCLEEENEASSLEFDVTFSYGYYCGRLLEDHTLDDYIHIADQKMYEMKHQSREPEQGKNFQ